MNCAVPRTPRVALSNVRLCIAVDCIGPIHAIVMSGSWNDTRRDAPLPLETQDIVAWGSVAPENIREEYKRIADLCAWGQKLGVNGFLRMEMDFLKGIRFSLLRPPSATSEVLHAGSWHNHYPDDIRIQLDLTRMISFYDTFLTPSLISRRFGQERFVHHIGGASESDIQRVLNRLETAVQMPHGGGSGVDWKTLVQVIVDRYQDRVEMVQFLLNITSLEDKTQVAKKVQTQLRVMLQPYLLHSVVPSVPKAVSTIYSWAAPIYKLCATSHTLAINTWWAAGVLNGFDEMLPYSLDQGQQTESVLSEWKIQLDTLMGWLDWSGWVKCKPACRPEIIFTAEDPAPAPLQFLVQDVGWRREFP
ncbi:uncharacterized protein BT62DRAFT_917095 [Guyanagaster necrorhizus]|uniref:Uncharacterized protein n=1 Tax=Guyanagaster necrorhizus TaxID=856835 RepID=A0A9P7W140_9AGAR|nr:uncharacterized protein BT62DRAFT_917095 [Guyanagaster necrorhizus MCA 3950]KAG7450793.1 hypothetical protein BT62DRAFT_917095 [Guyanagaster necrorhizus MCA 3950]